jgi:hypothetical protein
VDLNDDRRHRNHTGAAAYGPNDRMHATPEEQGTARSPVSALLVASRGYGAGSAGAGHGRPGRVPIYRVIWRPAVAEMVGEGRPCTVLMISLLSMPCR